MWEVFKCKSAGLGVGDLGNDNVILENWTKVLHVHFEDSEYDSKLFGSCNFLCYTREQVKREEEAIHQCQPTSLDIHFIRHTPIIPDAPIFCLNPFPRCYTPPPKPLPNTTTTPPCLTLQYLKPLPYHTKWSCHPLAALWHHLQVSQHFWVSLTPLPFCFPQNHFFVGLLSLLASCAGTEGLDSLTITQMLKYSLW